MILQDVCSTAPNWVAEWLKALGSTYCCNYHMIILVLDSENAKKKNNNKKQTNMYTYLMYNWSLDWVVKSSKDYLDR